MPNRILKESICTSETISQLSWFEEIFFYRLIVNCDDYGRFDGRPLVIKGRLFPLKNDVTEKSIESAINKLSTVGLIMPYTNDGKPILQLVTWDKYQSIRNKRSKYPALNGSNTLSASENIQLILTDSTCKQMKSNDCKCPRNPIQSESNPNPNTNKGTEIAVPCEILSEWKDYCDMRKKVRKPMTKKAEELALKELNKLAPNDYEIQKKILNQSVLNSWQGLFPLKGDGYSAGNAQHGGNNRGNDGTGWDIGEPI